MTSREGRRLVEVYRLLQVRLGNDGAAAAVQLVAESANMTSPATMFRMMRLLVGQHDVSAQAGATFHNRLRLVEGATSRFAATPVGIPPDVVQAAADWYQWNATVIYRESLDATGDADVARQRVASRWAGSLARHVRNGGRRTLAAAMRGDPDVVRYERITDADPCAWCAMLASRGAVYLSEASGGGNTAWHDRCGCIAVPKLRGDQDVDPQNARFAEAWDAHATGANELAAFRSWYRERDDPI